MEISERILILMCIAMAVSVIAMTVTKAVIFRGVREYVSSKSNFFGELFSCPFCFSFYVSLLLIVFPFNAIPLFGFVGYFVTYFAIIGIAAIFSGLIYYLFSLME